MFRHPQKTRAPAERIESAMRRSFALPLLAVTFITSTMFGQGLNSGGTSLPVAVDSSFFQSLGATPKHTKFNQMSSDANAATTQAPQRIVSVPNFSRAFAFQGQVFPYTMMGKDPSLGKTTRIPTTYVPMSLFFDQFVDKNGNNIFIDATAITDEIKQSPNFENADYSSGETQFGDAVQRAEFFSIINTEQHDRDDWHTLLGTPQTLIPVTIEVPAGSAVVFAGKDGSLVALIDINFIVSQLNT